MVNLPTLTPIATELAPVTHLTNNGQANSRKRMANCGFMRSDRWSLKHGYSYNTVNKYRDELYGDEGFLPPTPSTGGRIRIANEVAEKLRQHGVRPRHSEANRRPNCPPRRTNTAVAPAPSPEKIAMAVYRGVADPEFAQAVITLALGKHGMTGMLEMLIQAEADISKDCPDCSADKDATS